MLINTNAIKDLNHTLICKYLNEDKTELYLVITTVLPSISSLNAKA